MTGLLDDVTEAMSALTTALENTTDTTEMLTAVCAEAIRAVPGADMASITIIDDRGGQTAASTDERAVEVDKAQYAAGDGPCLHATKTGQIVRLSLPTARELWPGFVATATRAGIGSYLAAPLRVDDHLSGAINLFGFDDHGFQKTDSKLLDLYTTVVTFGLRTTRRYQETRELADNLDIAMKSRAVIEQAKGILMATHRITQDQAMRRLIEHSQRTNTTLRQAAADLVRTASTPD
ncbi:ANTAR domain-containing protein [Kibdelosporangium aridum]|uniref:ANTAR domain-containing protein n=1 Tax=Kibdelosporangium aridum TaxID=2030 RepID=A0A428ZHI6_KIBAR|nr:GAF and ANTAR domain-containing protein [Kibdelosporangium aridum]RSM87420.1 ANTAR domain-containing protein [Kibdelosporangium aridum]